MIIIIIIIVVGGGSNKQTRKVPWSNVGGLNAFGQYLISKGADPSIKNHQGTTCYEGLGGGGDKKK